MTHTNVIKQAQDLITSCPDKEQGQVMYRRCWKSLGNKDKVRLEKWWLRHHANLSFGAVSYQKEETKIVHQPALIKEQELINEDITDAEMTEAEKEDFMSLFTDCYDTEFDTID